MDDILKLLSKYSFSDIFVFIILLLAAIKGGSSFIEWAVNKKNAAVNGAINRHDKNQQLEQRLQRHEETMQKINEVNEKIMARLDKIDAKLDLLTQSDKQDIKSFITREHHYFCERGWIDDFSLDCCERRFECYQKEHGNSFVENLMNQMRALPKVPPHNN